MAHHNNFCDKVSDLAIKSFTPTHVREDPKIYAGFTVHGGKDKIKGSPSSEEGDMKGGIPIRDLWTQVVDIFHCMCVVNNDTTFYQYKNTWKCL